MPTFTAGDVSARILDRLDGNSALYTSAERRAVMTEFLRVLNLFTGMYISNVNVPGFTQADQLIYNFPSPILYPMRIAFNGKKMEPMPFRRLARKYPNWAREKSHKYGPSQRWSRIGTRKFIIHPIDHYGGNDLIVTGVTEPTPIASDGDLIILENAFVDMMVEYCSHRLMLKESGKIFADGSLLYQTFLRSMKTRMMWQDAKLPRYWILTEAKAE